MRREGTAAACPAAQQLSRCSPRVYGASHSPCLPGPPSSHHHKLTPHPILFGQGRVARRERAGGARCGAPARARCVRRGGMKEWKRNCGSCACQVRRLCLPSGSALCVSLPITTTASETHSATNLWPLASCGWTAAQHSNAVCLVMIYGRCGTCSSGLHAQPSPPAQQARLDSTPPSAATGTFRLTARPGRRQACRAPPLWRCCEPPITGWGRHGKVGAAGGPAGQARGLRRTRTEGPARGGSRTGSRWQRDASRPAGADSPAASHPTQ